MTLNKAEARNTRAPGIRAPSCQAIPEQTAVGFPAQVVDREKRDTVVEIPVGGGVRLCAQSVGCSVLLLR